jgi:hypothetical protein
MSAANLCTRTTVKNSIDYKLKNMITENGIDTVLNKLIWLAQAMPDHYRGLVMVRKFLQVCKHAEPGSTVELQIIVW